MADDVT